MYRRVVWPWILCFVIGAGMSYLGMDVLRKAMKSSYWPVTTGRIISSSIEETRDREGEVSQYARILYKYVVDGTEYTSTTVSFGRYNADPNQVVKRYPAGTVVTVHYDPSKPAVAVLEPGTSWESYGLLTIGAVITAVGLAGTVLSCRIKR